MSDRDSVSRLGLTEDFKRSRPVFYVKNKHTGRLVLRDGVRVRDVRRSEDLRTNGVSLKVARDHAEMLGLDLDKVSLEQWVSAIEVELEHGVAKAGCPVQTQITLDDIDVVARIALVHLAQYPDYYERLHEMEEEAEQEWKDRGGTPSVFAVFDECTRCDSRGETKRKVFSDVRIRSQNKITKKQARDLASHLGVNLNPAVISIDEWLYGLNTELEHASPSRLGRDLTDVTDVTGGSLLMTGKVALAHIVEFPDYYARLQKMTEEAAAYWKSVGFVQGDIFTPLTVMKTLSL